MSFRVSGEVYVRFYAFEMDCLRDADGRMVVVSGYGQ